MTYPMSVPQFLENLTDDQLLKLIDVMALYELDGSEFDEEVESEVVRRGYELYETQTGHAFERAE